MSGTLFPSVEAWAVGYLDGALSARLEPFTDDVFVATKVPNPRHRRMVIVRRDGGVQLDVARDNPRLGIRVWAPTDEEVDDLTQMVRALIYNATGNGPVRRVVETGGPIEVPEVSGQPLRYFTASLIVRGTALS